MNRKLMNVPFSPPDISDEEINEVVDTLRSGWITTGPKTKLFESKIAELCHTSKAVCLNSATAALSLFLEYNLNLFHHHQLQLQGAPLVPYLFLK